MNEWKRQRSYLGFLSLSLGLCIVNTILPLWIADASIDNSEASFQATSKKFTIKVNSFA